MTFGIKRDGRWITDPMTDLPRRFDSELAAYEWGRLSYSHGLAGVNTPWKVQRHAKEPNNKT